MKPREERQIKNRIYGEPIPEDQFRVAVRRLLNDKLDAYFEACGVDEARPGMVGDVAEVAASWISDSINADNVRKLDEDQSDYRK